VAGRPVSPEPEPEPEPEPLTRAGPLAAGAEWVLSGWLVIPPEQFVASRPCVLPPKQERQPSRGCQVGRCQGRCEVGRCPAEGRGGGGVGGGGLCPCWRTDLVREVPVGEDTLRSVQGWGWG